MPVRKGSDITMEVTQDRGTLVEANEPAYNRDWGDKALDMEALFASCFSRGSSKRACRIFLRNTHINEVVDCFIYQASDEGFTAERS